MLGHCPLVAFILTGDVAAAKKFYSETLGLKFVRQDEFAVVYDAHGTMLRLTSVGGHAPSPHTVVGWNVEDINATAAEMVKAGLAFLRFPFFEQDELGIWTAPDGKAKVAWFKDPEGNMLSISQA